MARKQASPTSPQKCPKVWEKNRRDKMKGMFEELSRLLPHHDPAVPISRMNVVHGALSYIRELQAQNEDLLKGGFDQVHQKKLERWKKRVKELVSRVEQLTGILRTANIRVPPLALEAVPAWTKTRPKQWTDKISIPEGKVEEMFERLAEAKRKKKQSDSINRKKPCKRRKKNADKGDVIVDSGSKENLPTPKTNSTTQTTATFPKAKKQVTKFIVHPNNSVQPQTVVTGPHSTPTILQGSIMTPIAQPSTYILTGQGNLLPVLTPSANLLTPVVINKPPVLVVQSPQVPKAMPVVLARPPINKRKIQRESTVMTFSNKMPIPALSSQSHTRRGGKCTAHKTQNKAIAPSTCTFLNQLPVDPPSSVCAAGEHISVSYADGNKNILETSMPQSEDNEASHNSIFVAEKINVSKVTSEKTLLSEDEQIERPSNIGPISTGANRMENNADVASVSPNSVGCRKEEPGMIKSPSLENLAPLITTISNAIKIDLPKNLETSNVCKNSEAQTTTEVSTQVGNKLADSQQIGTILTTASITNAPVAVTVFATTPEKIDGNILMEANSALVSTPNANNCQLSEAYAATCETNLGGEQSIDLHEVDSLPSAATFSKVIDEKCPVASVGHGVSFTSPTPGDSTKVSTLLKSVSQKPFDSKMSKAKTLRSSKPPALTQAYAVVAEAPNDPKVTPVTSAVSFIADEPLSTLVGPQFSGNFKEPLCQFAPKNEAESSCSQNLQCPEQAKLSHSFISNAATMPLMAHPLNNSKFAVSTVDPMNSECSNIKEVTGSQLTQSSCEASVCSVSLVSTPPGQANSSQAVICVSETGVTDTRMASNTSSSAQTKIFSEASSSLVGKQLFQAHSSTPAIITSNMSKSATSQILTTPSHNFPIPPVSISQNFSFNSQIPSYQSAQSIISPNVTQSSSNNSDPLTPSVRNFSTAQAPALSQSVPLSSLVPKAYSSPRSVACPTIPGLGPVSCQALNSPVSNFLHPQTSIYSSTHFSSVSASLREHSSSQPIVFKNMQSEGSHVSKALTSANIEKHSYHNSISQKMTSVPITPVQAYSADQATDSRRIPEPGFLSAQAHVPLVQTFQSFPKNSEPIKFNSQAAVPVEPTYSATKTMNSFSGPATSNNVIATSSYSTALNSASSMTLTATSQPPSQLLFPNKIATTAPPYNATTVSSKTESGTLSSFCPKVSEAVSVNCTVPSQPVHTLSPSESKLCLEASEAKPLSINLTGSAVPKCSDLKSSKPNSNEAGAAQINSSVQAGPCSKLPVIGCGKTQSSTSSIQSYASSPKATRNKESSAIGKHVSSKHSSSTVASIPAAATVSSTLGKLTPQTVNHKSSLQSVAPQLTVKSSTTGSYIALPAASSIRAAPQYTSPSWTNAPSLGGSSMPVSNPAAEVSWPTVNALRAPHLPPASACDNSWLLPSSAATFSDGNKPLGPTLTAAPSSWRPLPNDVYWNSSGENWPVPSALLPAKKTKALETSAAIATKAVAGNSSGNANDTIQWPVKAPSVELSGSQIGLYPFSSGTGFSTPVPVPVCEPAWTSNLARSFVQEGTNSTSAPSNRSSTSSVKSQTKGQSYYPPSMHYLPPSSNYGTQGFPKDAYSPSNASFLENSPVTVSSANHTTFLKSTSKQPTRSSTVPSKPYSNVSDLASSGQQTSTKINHTLGTKQNSAPSQNQTNFVASVSTPTYIATSSKVAVSDTFFPTCHYSVADSSLYNPFAENNYASTLMKQTLPETSSYTVNFANAYCNDAATNTPYPLSVSKTLLSDPPYALTALRTSINDNYYPGVPVYSSSMPNVIPSESVTYSNNPPKSVKVEVSRNSSSVTVSHGLDSLKMSVSEAGITQSSAVSNISQLTYPPIKSQEPAAASSTMFTTTVGKKASEHLPSSKCHTSVTGSSTVKTSQSMPVWNSYFSQVQSVTNAPESAVQWGQSEYACLSYSKDNRPKPPINWMTEPESRSDIVCPPDDPFQPRYQNSFDRKESINSQNMFDYCGAEDSPGKAKTRKKEESTSQDYFSWAPMKVDPLVVPGTLPTLVGDLALGGEPLPIKRSKTAMFLQDSYPVTRCNKDPDLNNPVLQEPFTNLSKNIFEFSQNDIPKASSAETIVLKNIFELPAPPVGKQKSSQGQNSFLSVSQLVESHNMEPSVEKNEYSYYTQKPGKTKRSSGWKCNEKKCQQVAKNCSSYSAEALLRSQDASESDFSVPTSGTFPIEFTPDSSLMDTSDLITGQMVNKHKTYSQRYRKQDCWKGQDLRQAPPSAVLPVSSAQPFPGKPPPVGKTTETDPVPFPYLPDPRLSATPLPSCSATALPFPRFPNNPSATLLPAPGFTQRKDSVHFTGIFPSSPGRPSGQVDPIGARYPGPKKPYSYPRSSKASFPPCSPSFSNEASRKSAGKSTSQPVPSFPVLPQPAGPSGSSLANFNLSTIFPEMNKKGNYPYP